MCSTQSRHAEPGSIGAEELNGRLSTTRSEIGLAGLLLGAGISHFAATRFYRPLVPPFLGDPERVVYVSGLAELGIGAALIPSSTRRPAGYLAAALFVAIFPGNLYHAWSWRHLSTTRRVATVARLPLQAGLVWWALHIARAAKPVRVLS